MDSVILRRKRYVCCILCIVFIVENRMVMDLVRRMMKIVLCLKVHRLRYVYYDL